MSYIIYSLLAITVSYLLLKNFYKFAKKFNLIDNKNKNYALNPTLTGSGIVFLLIFIIGNMFFFIFEDSFKSQLPNRYYLFLISIFILTTVSFRDDLKSIDPILRLVIQIICVYLSIATLNLNTIPLPTKLVFLIAVLIWIYIINISNFIDGSDGFLISTFIFYCLNLIIILIFFKIKIFSGFLALICFPFALVFFIFNKPPAKLFMGDAGSIFIGFVSGFWFLELILIDKWYLAISLASYSLVDCTICLLKKIKKGIMPWIGLYDYFFLIPILKKKTNHYNVLFLQIIFLFMNTIIIFIQELFEIKILFLLSIILSILLTHVYKNLEEKYNFLKIIK